MPDDDVREVYLVTTECAADCLVGSDDPSTLLDVLYTGTVKLCLDHLEQFQRRADAREGMHLNAVETTDVERG